VVPLKLTYNMSTQSLIAG